MALSYGTAYGSWFTGAGNPLTANYTCDATAKVMVLYILNATTTARTTDAPTYNGVGMTQAGASRAGSAECNVEIWYLINPPTGGNYQISIDNDGGLTLFATCHTLNTAQSAALFGAPQNNGTSSATPSCTINNVPAGGACVSVLGHGYKDPPTGRSHTVILETDQGAWSSNAQYTLVAALANITMSWTLADTDDVAMIMAAFQEIVNLTIGTTAHSHAAEAPVLTQEHNITVQDGAHAQTLEAPVLVPGTVDLIIADLDHAQTLEAPELVPRYFLIIADLNHAQKAGPVIDLSKYWLYGLPYEGLVSEGTAKYWDTGLPYGYIFETDIRLQQFSILTVANLFHAHELEAPILEAGETLVVDDASHAQVLEAPILTQLHELVINNADHNHAIEAIDLSQTQNIVVADADHAHILETFDLSQQHILTLQDLIHAHAAETPALTQLHNLITADLSHAHTIDNTEIVVIIPLVPANLSHAQTIDNIDLSQKYYLGVADGYHVHSADSPALTQLHLLAVQDLEQAQTIDNIDLFFTLAVADLVHSQAIDNIILIQLHNIAVQSLAHAHELEGNLVLNEGVILAVADLYHAHFTSNWLDMGYVPTADRTLYLAAESRTLDVASEDRTLYVLDEDRKLAVNQ